MRRHTATILALLVAGALSMLLFTIKHQVQDLEDEFTGLNRSIVEDEQAVHVLKAEWSHLNDPKRLRGLASRHLGLKPIEPEQIGHVSDLPENDGESQQETGTGTQTDDFFQLISSALKDGRAGQ